MNNHQVAIWQKALSMAQQNLVAADYANDLTRAAQERVNATRQVRQASDMLDIFHTAHKLFFASADGAFTITHATELDRWCLWLYDWLLSVHDNEVQAVIAYQRKTMKREFAP